MATKKGTKKTTVAKKIQAENGKLYVNATFNNTLVTVTDGAGQTLAWSSSGRMGFKGTRKSTPFAATSAVETVLRKAKDEMGMKSIEVFIKGPGPGRDAALRAVRGVGLRMDLIADLTPMPFNGPRAKKKRRA